MATAAHDIVTTLGSDQLETQPACSFLVEHCQWHRPRGSDRRPMESGDPITVTSADGDVFIGTFHDRAGDGAILIELS